MACDGLLQILIVGCPAEECGGGGKIDLIKAGAFKNVNTSMMCHPYPRTLARCIKFSMAM